MVSRRNNAPASAPPAAASPLPWWDPTAPVTSVSWNSIASYPPPPDPTNAPAVIPCHATAGKRTVSRAPTRARHGPLCAGGIPWQRNGPKSVPVLGLVPAFRIPPPPPQSFYVEASMKRAGCDHIPAWSLSLPYPQLDAPLRYSPHFDVHQQGHDQILLDPS